DDQIPDAEPLDEGHHLLLRAGADGQHRQHRRHAENHPEHRQQRAQLVKQQVVEAAADVGHPQGGRRSSRAGRGHHRHRAARCGAAGACGRGRAPDPVFGLTSAISVAASMFSTMATLSVQARTRTSRASNPSEVRTYTVGLPAASNTAVRGTYSTLSKVGPEIEIAAETPGRTLVWPPTSKVMSNCRVPASKIVRDATPLTARTVPRSFAPGSASPATSTACPGATFARSRSDSFAVTSISEVSNTSAT